MREQYHPSFAPSEEETARRRGRARRIREQNKKTEGIPGGPRKVGGARPATRASSVRSY